MDAVDDDGQERRHATLWTPSLSLHLKRGPSVIVGQQINGAGVISEHDGQ
jgi:hypothetical protein